MDKSIKQMIRIIITCLLLINLIPGIVLAVTYYHTGWVIGKSIDEIQERYGAFDYYSEQNREGGYFIEEEHPGIIDFVYAKYWMIDFDENNIAIRCYAVTDSETGFQYLSTPVIPGVGTCAKNTAQEYPHRGSIPLGLR